MRVKPHRKLKLSLKLDCADTVREELDGLIIDGKHWATGLATAVKRYSNKRAVQHAKTIAKKLRDSK